MVAKIVEHSFVIYGRMSTFVFLTLLFFCVVIISPSVSGATLNDNSYLSDLAIEGMDLTPGFRKTTLFYQVEIPDESTQLNIIAVPEDERAQVEITGNEVLRAGRNTIDIAVIAQDGTRTHYEIAAFRAGVIDTGDAMLRQLSILDYALTPQFREDILEYFIEVDYSVDALEIVAVPNNPDSQVAITGNEDFQVGENKVTIAVVSKNGDTQSTYSITVNKFEEIEVSWYQSGIARWPLIIYAPWAAIALGAIAVLGYVIVRSSKRSGTECDV